MSDIGSQLDEMFSETQSTTLPFQETPVEIFMNNISGISDIEINQLFVVGNRFRRIGNRGFIVMPTLTEANLAIIRLNGLQINGKILLVQLANGKRKKVNKKRKLTFFQYNLLQAISFKK